MSQSFRIILIDYHEKIADIQAIRQAVFQDEQGVDPALEFDGYDETAKHLLAYLNDKPVGTARIRYLDVQTVKLERLAVLQTARGQGIGKKLMEKAIHIVQEQGTYSQIIVHAQAYIQPLYQTLGFMPIGGTFYEANIPHVKMIKTLTTSRS